MPPHASGELGVRTTPASAPASGIPSVDGVSGCALVPSAGPAGSFAAGSGGAGATLGCKTRAAAIKKALRIGPPGRVGDRRISARTRRLASETVVAKLRDPYGTPRVRQGHRAACRAGSRAPRLALRQAIERQAP